MGQPQPIDHELSISEVLSKTLELYRNNFINFVLLFAVIEAMIGVVTWLVSRFYVIPVVPVNPTPAQFASYFGSFFGAVAVILLFTFLISVIFLPVAEGATIKMASEEITGKKIDLMEAVSFAFSKLLSLWAVFIVVGIIVIVGLIALIIPGIILAIMFGLSIPVLLIENKGVLDSMSRSRQLVGGRWLKTFATFFVIVIIIAIIGAVLTFISSVAGPERGILNSILSALTAPAIPIALTVYYYSNVARTSSAQASSTPPMAPAAPAMAQPGMKFCPTCGTQMPNSAVFCPKCGAKQPA